MSRWIGGTLRKGSPSTRPIEAIEAVVIHRFGGWKNGVWVYPPAESIARGQGVPWDPELVGMEYGEDPIGVARFAVEVMGWPCHPYTLQAYQGELLQTSPLDVITPHAWRFNRPTVSILVTGDHRRRHPAADDLEAAIRGAAGLCQLRVWNAGDLVTIRGQRAVGEAYRVGGHDEMPPGGTATPGKECPGALISMPSFRIATANLAEDTTEAARFVLH